MSGESESEMTSSSVYQNFCDQLEKMVRITTEKRDFIVAAKLQDALDHLNLATMDSTIRTESE